MNIAYIITTYNPLDNNPNYVSENGYIYKNIQSALSVLPSKHNIDFYICDFCSGTNSREFMVNIRDRNKWPIKFAFGPDMSQYVAVNKTISVINANYSYDLVIVTASDISLDNPGQFDSAMDNISSSSKLGCGMFYFKVIPGLPMPISRVPEQWFNEMPMHGAVHCHAVASTGDLLRFYNNKMFADVTEGCAEGLCGFYVQAAGYWRKIISEIQFSHSGRREKPDRKYAFDGKMRGLASFVKSAFSNRNSLIDVLTSQGESNGIEFMSSKHRFSAFVDKYYPTSGEDAKRIKLHRKLIGRYTKLKEQDRKKMEVFIREHFFLNQQELDYSAIPLLIL